MLVAVLNPSINARVTAYRHKSTRVGFGLVKLGQAIANLTD